MRPPPDAVTHSVPVMASERIAASVVAIAAAIAVGGCGQVQASGSERAKGAAPALPDATVLPGMSVTTRTLDRSQLAMQTPISGLSNGLRAWGFTGAREREFTGGRRTQLEHVVARTVGFRDPAGAGRYTRALIRGAGVYLGTGARTSKLRSARGDGWLIHPPSCDSHPRPPTLIAVLPGRGQTVWLSLTGDDATSSRARTLAVALWR